MEGKRLLRTLRLTNFLSYGPQGTEIELQPLNVLIGPNGSGKSNLIEAIRLLKAAPTNISAPIRTGGGMPEWLWKGGQPGTGTSVDLDFEIEVTVTCTENRVPLRYKIRLAQVGQGLELTEEAIENEVTSTPDDKEPYSFYQYRDGNATLTTSSTHVASTSIGSHKRRLPQEDLNRGQSILSQWKDPELYPELTYLSRVFSEIALFRTITLGPRSVLRGPQAADQPSSFLLGDGRNLGMVLNDLLSRPATKRLILERLTEFYEDVEDITTKVHAGTVETLFHERGLSDSMPSIRLSDGTLRYLCLLVILCHPSPPPLVCIEEPEVGLHPDIIPRMADLLTKASERMQLVVTTHSDILVSALSHMPEAVVVCERDDWGSHLRRLDADQLEHWLEKYTLGEAWLSGEIGGTA